MFDELPIQLSLPDATVTYYPQWLEANQASSYQMTLQDELQWSQDYIKLYGREVKIPRLQAWYGEPEATYTYSQLAMKPMPWHSVLADLRATLEQECNTQFNSVLANWYRNGQDSMGMHSDDEPVLGVQPVIASLTFGAARGFIMKHKLTGQKEVLELAHGSLLVMSGDTQTYWQHGINKTKKRIADRINLTFRHITPVES